MIEKDFQKQHQTLLATMEKGDAVDPDEYPKPLKIYYWRILRDYSNLVKEHSKDSPALKEDSQYFNDFYNILSALEFKERKVEKLNDNVASHLQYLENKVYHFTSSLSFQYVSWQQESKLVSDTTSTGLITTNKGYCVGGEAGLENRYFHYYMDGCFLFGSGGVAAPDSTDITYQQSSIPAYGFKGGPGASMIVSSSGSRLGLKVPIIYSTQKLTDPSGPGYKIVQGSPLSVLVSLYSRWQFDKWYVQTEFGKYLKKEQTFWGLGLGKNF